VDRRQGDCLRRGALAAIRISEGKLHDPPSSRKWLLRLRQQWIFLVHGNGIAASSASSGTPQPARAPRLPELTGLAAAGFDFADEVRVWFYDKADYTVRMDVETGMFEDVLLADMPGGGPGGMDAAGMSARGMSARGMSARRDGRLPRLRPSSRPVGEAARAGHAPQSPLPGRLSLVSWRCLLSTRRIRKNHRDFCRRCGMGPRVTGSWQRVTPISETAARRRSMPMRCWRCIRTSAPPSGARFRLTNILKILSNL
jgi:hypothetical protein